MARRRSARVSGSGPVVLRVTSYRPTSPSGNSSLLSGPASVRQAHCRASVPLQSPKRAPTPFVTILRDPGTDPVFLTLTLPLPPSINHIYATVQGRRLLSSAGRRFKTHVGQEVLCLLAARRQTIPTAHGLNRRRLALDLHFYFGSMLRRDIDGGLKITQDALCEALGINDNRIVEVSLRKDVDACAPRMELSLRVTD
jgi:crossover junction endodeoxyribonuclease RusA